MRRPFTQPGQLFLDGSHEALGVSVALWAVVAGEGKLDAQRRRDLHEGHPRLAGNHCRPSGEA